VYYKKPSVLVFRKAGWQKIGLENLQCGAFSQMVSPSAKCGRRPPGEVRRLFFSARPRQIK
jgi:hypothetical protein